MRYRAKVDRNQPDITKALRDFGCSVQPIHTIGKGCPDLLVGYGGRYGVGGVNLLFEIKDPEAPNSRTILTADEWDFREAWRGQYDIVLTALQAIAIVREKETKC